MKSLKTRIPYTGHSQLAALRRGCAVLWVLLALLLAPTLGVWHGYVHSHEHHLAGADDDDDEGAQATGWMARLYASHHHASDCQQFDQAAHADALTSPAASVALLAPVALQQPVAVASPAPACCCAHYAARAPPLTA